VTLTFAATAARSASEPEWLYAVPRPAQMDLVVRGVLAAHAAVLHRRRVRHFLTEEEGKDRIEAAYGKAVLQRLGSLKSRFDPAHMFRHAKSVLG